MEELHLLDVPSPQCYSPALGPQWGTPKPHPIMAYLIDPKSIVFFISRFDNSQENKSNSQESSHGEQKQNQREPISRHAKCRAWVKSNPQD